MNYEKILKREQNRQKYFDMYGSIPSDAIRYKKFLKTRHHHEILPERLFLISKIKKAFTEDERGLYLNRYMILEEMNPNPSWFEYVNNLTKGVK